MFSRAHVHIFERIFIRVLPFFIKGTTIRAGSLMGQFYDKDTSPEIPNAPNRNDLIIGELNNGRHIENPKGTRKNSRGESITLLTTF